jgi:hypothetical protein
VATLLPRECLLLLCIIHGNSEVCESGTEAKQQETSTTRITRNRAFSRAVAFTTVLVTHPRANRQANLFKGCPGVDDLKTGHRPED